MKTRTAKRLLEILLILGVLFLYTHLCISFGVMKERKSKSCIGIHELEIYEKTLNIASDICIGVQKDRSDEISKANTETQKWRDSYFILKNKQNEITLNND